MGQKKARKIDALKISWLYIPIQRPKTLLFQIEKRQKGITEEEISCFLIKAWNPSKIKKKSYDFARLNRYNKKASR